MRNPLNSIINQCCVQEENCRNLAELIKRIDSQIDDHAKKQLSQILSDLRQSDVIQVSSSKLLLFHVEDILGMA
jgi:hypothetical protein